MQADPMSIAHGSIATSGEHQCNANMERISMRHSDSLPTKQRYSNTVAGFRNLTPLQEAANAHIQRVSPRAHAGGLRAPLCARPD